MQVLFLTLCHMLCRSLAEMRTVAQSRQHQAASCAPQWVSLMSTLRILLRCYLLRSVSQKLFVKE